MYNVTLRRVLVTIVAMEKQQVLHILSVCVALVVQYAMCMHHIVLCGLYGIFRHCLIKGTTFGK